MKFFTVLSALGLVAAVAAESSSAEHSTTLSTATTTSYTPEQTCIFNCKLDTLLTPSFHGR
jgi:hypothetical protein